MWQRFLAWIHQLLGQKARSPEEQVEAWLQELAAQVPRLDNAAARLKAEATGAEHLLEQLEFHIADTEAQIADALKRGDRAHAASLALEREQLQARRPHREEQLRRARADWEQTERIRRHFMKRQAEETQRLRSLLREHATAALMAEVQAIHATVAAGSSPTLSTHLLAEAEAAADAERGRLRVAADLAVMEHQHPAEAVHSTQVAMEEQPPALETTSE